jgi:hypothetical protein
MEPEIIIALLVIGLIVVIFLLYHIFSILKLIFKRLSLISKIKALCKQSGVRCEVRSSLGSLFSRRGREDIALEKSGKWYYVYIFSSRFTACRYHITSEYVQLYKKSTVIRPKEKDGEKTHGFQSVYETRWRALKGFYIEEYDDSTKILLIHPTPDQISTYNKDGETVALMNGDTVFGNVVYYSESGISRFITSKE